MGVEGHGPWMGGARGCGVGGRRRRGHALNPLRLSLFQGHGAMGWGEGGGVEVKGTRFGRGRGWGVGGGEGHGAVDINLAIKEKVAAFSCPSC